MNTFPVHQVWPKPFCKAERKGEKKTRQTEEEVGEDNIREWTGLAFAKSQRAVENREERRKLVVISSVVPHTGPTTLEVKGYAKLKEDLTWYKVPELYKHLSPEPAVFP